MPDDISDLDFEPEWLWATRITAEAARFAMVNGRTSLERFEIYERLILAACEERQHRKNPDGGDPIAKAAPATSANSPYGPIEFAEDITISGFDAANPV